MFPLQICTRVTFTKWLPDLKQPRIPEFCTLTKIDKKYRSEDQLFLVAAVRQSVFPVSLTQFYSQSLLNGSHTLKTLPVILKLSKTRKLPLTIVIFTQTFLNQKELILFLPIPTSDLQERMLEENSLKFNERHFLQTRGVLMGTKMAVAFSVLIFMADLERKLLLMAASPFKPLVCKRSIDDIISLWNIPIKEVSKFVNFANSFHLSIKFTCEMSSERAVFLDTEVFKGPLVQLTES